MWNNILIVSFIALLSACAPKVEEIRVPQSVVVKTVEIEKPKPIIPEPRILQMRDVKWNVITESNVSDKFTTNKVYYSLDGVSYQNMILNLNDMRSYIEGQKLVIDAYKRN